MRVATVLRILPLLLVFLLTTSPGWGQLFHNTEIKGQLRLANGKAGPGGIQILLEDSTRNEIARTTSDSQGKFLFTGISLANYTVSVHQLGYQTTSLQVDLSFSPSISINLSLLPDTHAEKSSQPPADEVSITTLQEPASKTGRAELKKGRERLFDANDPEGSLPHFAKLIEVEPNYGSGYLLKGIALLRMNRPPEAESALRSAGKLDPASFSPKFLLGVCLNSENQFAAAATILEKAVEQDPKSVEAHYELSRSYLALNRWQDAEPHALEAVKLNADFAPVHIVLGNIDLKKGDAKAALAEYEQYLHMDANGPFGAPARSLVAKIRSNLGMPPQ